jgi:hypothetical protein
MFGWMAIGSLLGESEALTPTWLQHSKEVVTNALPLLKPAIVCQNVKRVDYFFSRHN